MKYRVPAFVILIAAAVFEVTLGYSLSTHGIRPGFVFVAVYGLSVEAGEGRGMLYGALGGLIVDSTSGGLMGLMTSGYALTGFLAGRLAARVFNIGEAANLVGIFVLALVQGVYTAVVLGTFLDGYSILGGIIRYGLPQAVYNALLGAVLLWLVDREASARHFWGGLVSRIEVRI